MLRRIDQILPFGSRRVQNDAKTPVRRLYSVFTGARRKSSIRTFNLVYADVALIARTRSRGAAIRQLASSLKLYVAEHARGQVFIHAGVVEWKGKAIVIPGRSHAGKTTLVAELLRAGATYYSDEFAVLESDGRVRT